MRIDRFSLLLILLPGLIPLLWLVPGYVIAKGDYFPYAFSIDSVKNDHYMWTSNNLGTPSASPAYSLYATIWLCFLSLNTPIGLVQIIARAQTQ